MNEHLSELIINFTPTGMIPTKGMTPYVPVTPQEIIEDVHEACDMGISMAHIHARDQKTGEPTFRGDIYEEIISGIRKFAPDLVICVSLSGRNWGEFEKRAEPLLTEGPNKPDMGSLTLSSLNFNRTASVNEPDMILALAERMKEMGVKPELEAFDAGMVNYACYLQKRGLITPAHYFNLILGNIACAQADLLHAGIMVRDLPNDSLWSLGGIGDHQLAMNSLAVAMGGGVRVGLEDNIWFDPARTKLARNIDLIRRVHTLAGVSERPVMKPAALRKLLGLRDGLTGYGVAE